MILNACFQRFFFIFRIFHPPKIPFPLRFFLEDFFFSIKQDTFLILKLLLPFLKELVLGQGSFLAKCTGLQCQGAFLGDKPFFVQMNDYHEPLEQMLSVQCFTKF